MADCIIVARFRAASGHAGEVETPPRGFVGPSRVEDGCLFYDLRRKVADENGFVILDGRRDRAAFEVHALGAHVARTLTRFEPLLEAPPAIIELDRLT